MKSILISIKPKYCELIASGEKTIEVRKTRPKIKTPFKCYIYCTKPSKKYQTICGCMVINTDELYRLPNGKIKHDWSGELMCCNGEYTRDNFLNGKVIGEFICDKVMFLTPLGLRGFEMREEILKSICLTNDDLNAYGGLKTLYGWHISNLKIYDKPKPIMQFYKPCPIEIKNCPGCEFYSTNTGCCMNNIDRPPQSYMYVEEL